MTDLNSISLVGRLTRDSELKYTQGGTAVASFSIAVNYRKRNGDQWSEEANFFDVVYFGKMADSANQYLTKGKQVAVLGELRQERWQDSQTGQNRSKVSIYANSVQLLGGTGGQSQNGGSQWQQLQGKPQGRQAQQTQGAFKPRNNAPQQQFDGGFQEDLPF